MMNIKNIKNIIISIFSLLLIGLLIFIIFSDKIHGIWQFNSVINEMELQKEIDKTVIKWQAGLRLKKDDNNFIESILIRDSYHKEYLSFFGVASLINYGKGNFYAGGYYNGKFIIHRDSLRFIGGIGQPGSLHQRTLNSHHFYISLIQSPMKYEISKRDTLILTNENGYKLVYIRYKEIKDPRATWRSNIYDILHREF